MNYYNGETLLEQQQEIEKLKEQNAALAAQVKALQKDKSDLLTYANDAEKWFNRHDPNGYVSPKRETAKQHLAERDAQKCRDGFIAGMYSQLHQRHCSQRDQTEAANQYADSILKGGAK